MFQCYLIYIQSLLGPLESSVTAIIAQVKIYCTNENIFFNDFELCKDGVCGAGGWKERQIWEILCVTESKIYIKFDEI